MLCWPPSILLRPMPIPVAEGSPAAAIIAEEVALWSRVSEFLVQSAAHRY